MQPSVARPAASVARRLRCAMTYTPAPEARTDIPDPETPSPEFLRGAAIILAELARMPDGGDQVARMLMGQFEVALMDFEEAGVDQTDLVDLRRAFAALWPERSNK